MSKVLTAGLTALFIGMSPLAYAQAPALNPGQDRTADLKAFTEGRIEIVKVTLGLNPAQEKLWPAVEEAIRARAAWRHNRLTQLEARLNDDKERSPIDLLKQRAEVLGQRSANLKKLADAWEPLYATLDMNQKKRLRLVAVLILREMKDAVASRFHESEDEDEHE